MNAKFQLCLSILLGSQLLVLADPAKITSEGRLWGSIPDGAEPGSVPKPSSPNHPNSLVSAGVVDGKEYFAEIDEFMEGKQAADYCKLNGLKPATIESQNEVDLLNVTLREFNEQEGWYKMYWTAGTESQVLMEWGESRAPVNRSLVTSTIFTNSRHYCIRFYPYNAMTEFWIVRCDDMGLGFPLCQD